MNRLGKLGYPSFPLSIERCLNHLQSDWSAKTTQSIAAFFAFAIFACIIKVRIFWRGDTVSRDSASLSELIPLTGTVTSETDCM